MRKLLTWVLVTLGIAALVRRLKRSQTSAETREAPAEEGDDPADELRRKLQESRTAEAPEATAAESVDERRHGVHEQGQAALDEMQESTDR